jgi:NADPH-dependent ferric siderophore reductase
MNTHTPPEITRLRYELQRRTLTVTRHQHLTPHMIRITLTGADLQGFVSAAPDDHVKLLLPTAPGTEPQRRDYTPRHYDPARQELVIDFALHDAGPATEWARNARPGDPVDIGGPRGSAVVGAVNRWLLIGDETALPAIGRRIEEATPGTAITALAAVPTPQDEQTFTTAADLALHWVHRPASLSADPAPLLARLATLPIPPGTFVWIAAEGGVARALRHHVVTERGLPPGWLKASGYWVAGQADTTEKFG